MPVTPFGKDFATKFTHPAYDAGRDKWERLENIHRGGEEARQYLRRFPWETPGDTHYEERIRASSFLNFASRMTERFVGYLSAEAPTPGSGWVGGGLGEVRPEESRRAPLNPAEMAWLNVTSTGIGWTKFFDEAQRRAIVTGHRWIICEQPSAAATSRADEQTLRPYLLEASPIDVPNWHYEGPTLVAFVLAAPTLVLDAGEGKPGIVTNHVLYVAAHPLGDKFADGASVNGYAAMLDSEGEVVIRDSKPLEGDLSATGGRVPAVPLFFQRDIRPERFSVSGTEDISAVALAYADLSSAGDNDALEGGSRTLYIFGSRPESFNKGAALKEAGGRLIPFPPVVEGGVSIDPVLHDSASVSASSAIEVALKRKELEAATIAADKLNSAPTASGIARKVEWLDTKAPRLSSLAAYREQAENEALSLLAARFGKPDVGAYVVWSKRFDVEDTVEDWLSIFDAASKMQIDSPELGLAGIERMLRAKNVNLASDTWERIKAEAQAAADQRLQADALLAGGGAAEDTDDEPDTP